MSSVPSRERPGASRAYFKGHGLGNDYLVVEEGTAWRASEEAVGRICHRWEGVGGDGVVVLLRGESPPFRLRMFNPDGSEFERSGNGLRILAAHLFRTGRVGSEPFAVEVGGDSLTMQVHGADGRGEYDISVEMGRARVGTEAVGAGPGVVQVESRLALPEGPRLLAELVSVGNPHCVIFGESDPWRALTREALDRLGPVVSTHEGFPEGLNVQLARILSSDQIEFLVWERGVGHTTASGTSACAVAVAAVASGRLPAGDKTLVMEGGTLKVRVEEDLGVVLRGPVRAICDGEVDAGFARVLGGGRLPGPETAATTRSEDVGTR
ncbi:MAG: diaminopimelate epimerase [Gemmatimonadetes bacterium]|nr:diaminopimelate epimerase [Gemmatimonadota bacterium]NNK63157.1 diaminopimelate epimerase [Gemmatimonadota bacterium]